MMKSRFRKTVVVGVLVLALVGAVSAWKYFSSRESADQIVLSGNVEADEIQVGSRLGGRIAEVLVKDGQQVQKGQPLIRFERYDLESKKADAVAGIAQAEANLQKMLNLSRPEEIAEARARAEASRMNFELARNGPRKEEIDAARAELDAANADYEVARLTLSRVEVLTRTGVQSRQDLDNAKAEFDRASARRTAAGERLKILLDGTRPEEIERAERQYREAVARRDLVEQGARKEDIETARAQLQRARAALETIQIQVNELEVVAPADAFVEVLEVRPGDLIGPNAAVATLVEVDRLWVRVYVPSPELGFVQLGKEVSVTVDSFKNESFSGRVEQIATRGEFTPRNVQTREEREHLVYAVRVRLENRDGRLRAGMAADVVIPRH